MGQSDNKKARTAVLSVGSNSLLIILKIVVGLAHRARWRCSRRPSIRASTWWRPSSPGSPCGPPAARPTSEHPYGHGKVENISGTVEALLIFAAAAWIIYEAVHKLMHPQPIDMPVWGVAVMFVSAVVNTFVSRRLFKVGKETDSVALQADAWHLRTDVYTSVGVMFGLLGHHGSCGSSRPIWTSAGSTRRWPSWSRS